MQSSADYCHLFGRGEMDALHVHRKEKKNYAGSENTPRIKHNRMEPTYKPWNSPCDQPGADTSHCSGGIARLKKWLDDMRCVRSLKK
eukprot:1161781-Pelagomonas_calceolata.AAC.6